MIQGVILQPKRQIPDARGTVRIFIDDGRSFCSCYSTTVYKGIIKGWHGYKTKTLNYVVPLGLVRLVLWDTRPESPTYGDFDELFLGEQNYQMVTIPPGVMNAFQGIADPLSLAIVVADETFDEQRTYRIPMDEHEPFDWTRVNR